MRISSMIHHKRSHVTNIYNYSNIHKQKKVKDKMKDANFFSYDAIFFHEMKLHFLKIIIAPLTKI